MGWLLKGKKILLCVSGGIAAYKSAELIRLLKKEETEVNVVISEAGKKFIGETTLKVLSGNEVLSEMFGRDSGADVKHVSLPQESDLIVVAPATADVLGKLASGIANDLLSTLLLVPPPEKVLLCPAMNSGMWRHPAVRRNVEFLREAGYNIMSPGKGELACGYEGEGRMREPHEIVEEIRRLLSPRDFKEVNVIVTAGPTREFIDDVRFISNPSSGKMGYAFARVAKMRGANVCLISGPVAISPPEGVEVVHVESADDMMREVKKRIEWCDLLIKTAAVCDFKPEKKFAGKLKKEKAKKVLSLKLVPDILKELSKKKGNKTFVGFSAEVKDLEKNAKKKLKDKNLDFIVVNDVSRKDIGFGSDFNEGYIISASGRKTHIPLSEKHEFAWKVLDAIKESVIKQG